MKRQVVASMQETLDVQTHLVEDKRKTLDHTKKLLDAYQHVRAFKEEVSSAICFLMDVLKNIGPLDAIQDFAYQVFEKRAKPGSDETYLKRLRSGGQQHTLPRFKRLNGPC